MAYQCIYIRMVCENIVPDKFSPATKHAKTNKWPESGQTKSYRAEDLHATRNIPKPNLD